MKAPKCPECGVQISFLEAVCDEVRGYWLLPDGFYEDKFLYESKDRTFYCPHCGQEIFDNEKDALAFLRKGMKTGMKRYKRRKNYAKVS